VKEIVDIIDRLPQEVQQWANILTLIGVVGGLTFVIWLIGGLIADLTRPLFKRPNAKLRGKHRRG
jgi:hypothetical protein